MYYDELSIEEKKLVLQEVESESKSTLTAYLLLFFLGMFGAHNFYLGKPGAGTSQLILSILGYLTTLIFIGFIPLTIVGIWVIVDAFGIPGKIEKHKLKLREKKAQKLVEF